MVFKYLKEKELFIILQFYLKKTLFWNPSHTKQTEGEGNMYELVTS